MGGSDRDSDVCIGRVCRFPTADSHCRNSSDVWRVARARLCRGGRDVASAVATYAIGRWLGDKALRRFFGPQLNRISAGLLERGIMAVTLIRLIPGAPYMLVNFAAGALRIHPLDYVIGTALGLTPGFAVMAVLGRHAMDVIRDPTPLTIAPLFILFLTALGLSFGLQRVTDGVRKRRT